MAAENISPYECHVFVCTNDREGRAKSCADGESPLVRSALKKEINQRGWRGKVRISKSGCMGLCQNGPNVIIYPQKIWFSEVSPDDIGHIISSIEQVLKTAD
jgi:(2Fe-2S) ferredoxin